MSSKSAANQSASWGMVPPHWSESMREVNENFFDCCQANKALRIERGVQGDCEIMAPTGGETSWRNSILLAQLYNWAETDGSGVVFDSSGGFISA